MNGVGLLGCVACGRDHNLNPNYQSPARSAGNGSIKQTQFTKMIPFFQSLFTLWSCRQCQMPCHLGRAA